MPLNQSSFPCVAIHCVTLGHSCLDLVHGTFTFPLERREVWRNDTGETQRCDLKLSAQKVYWNGDHWAPKRGHRTKEAAECK